MLVIDVPNSFFMAGGYDSHKDHDVRRAVAGPLTLLASALDLAVVLIAHMNRAPSTDVLDRIAGSLGLSRSSRSVLAVVETPTPRASACSCWRSPTSAASTCSPALRHRRH